MLRQISEEVRVNLKDRLREIRDVIRQSRHDSGGAGAPDAAASHLPPLPGMGLLSHAASAVDDALSIAESLVPRDRPLKVDGTAVKSLRAYFPVGNENRQFSAERLFRRDMYYLTRAVLAGLGIEEARVQEASFSAVHGAMRKRHADLLAAMTGEGASTDSVAAVCSALLVECLKHHPVRLGEAGSQTTAATPTDTSFEINCLAPVVLACGLATKGDDSPPEPDILEIAMLAVEVRGDRIREACAKPDAVEDLTPVLTTLLTHLA